MAITRPLQQKKPITPGTGFTNIQRILQANKANPLGSTVSSGVNQAGQAARGAIEQAGTEFKSGVQAERGRLGAEAQRADRVLGDVSKATDEDVSAFEGIRGGLSKGPTKIKNADELKQKAFEAERLGSAAGSEAGRYGLLQRFVGGNKQYTGGQQRLDSMLLGQTGANQLREARKGTIGLSNKAEQEARAAVETGKVLQGEAKNLADVTIGRLGGQVVDYDKSMEAARVKAQADLAENQRKLRDQLISNEIEDENLYNRLGIKEGDQIFRTNLGDYFQARNNIATKENVQTQADFDRINALRRLSGQSLTGEASAILPAYTDKSQVDAFKNMETYDIAQEALRDKIAQERGEYKAADFENLAHIQLAKTALEGASEGDELAQRFSGRGRFVYEGGQNQAARLAAAKAVPQDLINKYNQEMANYSGWRQNTQFTDFKNALAEKMRKENPNFLSPEELADLERTQASWQNTLNTFGGMSKAVKDTYKFDRTLKKKPKANE